MTLPEEFDEQIRESRLIAILRLQDHANVVEIATTLVRAGVRCLEVTIERPSGLAALADVVAALGEEAYVGAGTVLRPSEVQAVADVGARFLVMPDTNVEVITAGATRGLVTLPGAFTPSDVATAVRAGAEYVKLFPAATGGEEHLRALLGPFPRVPFVPTGGVSTNNASRWFDAGATAVAMGSNLVPGSGSLEGLFERAAAAVRACRRV